MGQIKLTQCVGGLYLTEADSLAPLPININNIKVTWSLAEKTPEFWVKIFLYFFGPQLKRRPKFEWRSVYVFLRILRLVLFVVNRVWLFTSESGADTDLKIEKVADPERTRIVSCWIRSGSGSLNLLIRPPLVVRHSFNDVIRHGDDRKKRVETKCHDTQASLCLTHHLRVFIVPFMVQFYNVL